MCSSDLTTLIVLIPLVFIAYLVPYSLGFFESELALQQAPEFMQLTMLDYAMAIIATVVKNLLSAILFTILLMPLVFFAAFAEEKVKERLKLPALASTFAAVFLTAALAWIVLLFVFPWVINAIFWKLYWSPI